MTIAAVRKVFFPVLILVVLVFMAGCGQAPPPPEQPDGKGQKDRDRINQELSANPEVSAISWSPDAAAVLYVQKGKPDKAGFNSVNIWKVNEAQAHLIGEVSPGLLGFRWSPDSQYFLVSETPGEGVSNRIFNAATLQEEHKLQSLDVPVWSPDSRSLAYGFEQHNFGPSVGSLEVYQLGQTQGEPIWRTIGHLYKVEFWDGDGNIGYIEVDAKGQQTHKTTKNIRPSISGVHLRDTREAVKAALGSDYVETLPDPDILTFPEPVYRWTYDKGYRVFIGKDSGQVLEIIATQPGAQTNLGVKVGDTAARVLEVYRPRYMEPESIHGGRLYGIFKVEGAAALAFGFDPERQYNTDVNPDSRVTSIWLTYPNIMDDDF